MDRQVNNKKIKTLMKEIIILTLKRIAVEDDDFKKVLTGMDNNVLKDYVDTKVETRIKEMLQECAEKNPACTGTIKTMLNSIFSTVKLESVDNDNFMPLIPDVDSNLIEMIAKKMLNEIYLYRKFNGGLKAYIASLKNLLNSSETINPNEMFKITFLDKLYYFDILKEFDKLSPTIYKFDPNKVVTLNYADLDIVSLPDLIANNKIEINMAIEDMITQLEDSEEIVSKAIDILTLPTATDIYNKITKLKIKDVYVLTVVQIILDNLFDLTSDKNLPMLREALGGLLTEVNNRLKYFIDRIENFMNNKIVVSGVNILDKYNYEIVVTKPVWSELKNEHPEVNLNTLYGLALTIASENPGTTEIVRYVKGDDLIINKETYDNAITKFIDMLTLRNKQKEKTKLASMYLIPKHLLPNGKANDGLLTEIITNLTDELSLSTLSDINATAKSIITEYAIKTNNTGYVWFLWGLEDIQKLLGKTDIDPDEGYFLGSIETLLRWLTNQIRIV